jgi:D-arginine dehydrogenase
MAEDLGRHDVIVVGGGIAGVSLAGELAAGARVLLLERERQPAVHASGRSAAVSVEPLSTDAVFALTRATTPFLAAPPESFTAEPLVTDRGFLVLASPVAAGEVDAFLRSWQARCPGLREIDEAGARALVPVLREGCAARFVLDPTALALDTNEMLQGWLRRLRAGGGTLVSGAEVTAVDRDAGEFRVTTAAGTARAPVLVNAAGAWASGVAALAGAAVIDLVPHRRSAALVAPPADVDLADWPMVCALDESFYFKPEGGQIMLSPADETPSAPMDAWPEDIDLAVAVERVQAVADLPVERFAASWAGLRTFSPDRNPVYGWDPQLPGFYWCAGQGGAGFQTSAGAARWCAAEIGVGAPPAALASHDFRSAEVSACRFG